jgi:hypothetical protein
MKSLSLPQSTISQIIDDPALLSSPNSTSALSLPDGGASFILSHGYTRGFRDIFILNACLAAVAVGISVFMIEHKELTRDDEEELKRQGRDVDVETQMEVLPANTTTVVPVIEAGIDAADTGKRHEEEAPPSSI